MLETAPVRINLSKSENIAVPNNKAEFKTGKPVVLSKRTTFLVSQRDFDAFTRIAKAREMTISELLKLNIDQFGHDDVKKFDFEHLHRINNEEKEFSKLATFYVSYDNSLQLKKINLLVNKAYDSMKRKGLVSTQTLPAVERIPGTKPQGKHKIMVSDVVRYVISASLERESANREKIQTPEKTRIGLFLPENDYRVVQDYAEAKGMPLNRLLFQRFTEFTEADFHDYFIPGERGRKASPDRYGNPDSDPRGPWVAETLGGHVTKDTRPDLYYDLVNPETGVVYPCSAKGWRYSKETMAQLVGDGRIVWSTRKNGKVARKKYIAEAPPELFRTSIKVYAGMYPLLEVMVERLNVPFYDVLRAFIVFLADKIRHERLRILK